MHKRAFAAIAAICLSAAVHAQDAATPGKTLPVTVDNFDRAETDMQFARIVKLGGFGKFVHARDIDSGSWANRDVLHSDAVFDLDAGPVRILLPKAGKRFMSLMEITEDHYVYSVDYGPGHYTFGKSEIGTRYVFISLRIAVDASDPKDIEQARTIQDAVRAIQAKGPGRFDVPNWDPVSYKKMRDMIVALNGTLPDLRNAFGSRFHANAVRHLIGTAVAWGSYPDKDAMAFTLTPSRNDGGTLYKLSAPSKMPVNGFWSVTVYDARGGGAASVNSVNAKKSADGSTVVRFGGCDAKAPNCLPVTNGWNYMVRVYRPRDEIVNGAWRFPEAKAAN